uniref:EpsG family protein n=1 Tax=Paenibacillus sp. FSL F4-0243 TaxID=2954732 RepID=UPI00403FA066
MFLFYTFSLCVILSAGFQQNTVFKSRYVSNSLLILFLILIMWVVPKGSFYDGDMINYITTFQRMNSLSLSDSFKNFTWEPLFLLLQWVLSRFSSSIDTYLFVTFGLYATLLIVALKKLFVTWQQIYIFFAYLNFTFFYIYIFVGSRQGFSIMFMLIAIGLMLAEEKKYKFYLCAIASILCHYSVLPVILFLVAYKMFNISLKPVLVLWIVSAFLFLTKQNTILLKIPFISKMDFISLYTSNVFDSFSASTSNNIFYFIFSAFFLMLSIILYKKISMSDEKKIKYIKLITCYAAFNIFYLLLGYIAFSYRVAMYSWFLVPILVYYPILNNEKKQTLLLPILVTATLIIGLSTTIFDYFL